ncbi:FAD-dependent monooxygenase [Streptomyces blattellae]|uniref:FAD-dependent monooxygenase n=1 Tax=Streptomyces blattellae TaxID=2569855 RepID=UPI0012B8B6DC|nr:FAD-dependent monooxygenase [Streptomyces blattellae]
MTSESNELSVDVLIVGGGPVGTALAVELGSRGIRCQVVERRTSKTPQPKAKLTNVRTMTLMRRWGLADEVRSAAPLPPTFPSDIAFVTRLTGWELFRFSNGFSTTVNHDLPYPEPAQQVPQNVLEDVLRARAGSLPNVTWSAGVTVERIEQTADHVIAHATESATGKSLRIRCRYLAGCDGAHSVVRQQLGVEMDGDDVLAHNAAAVFRAPTLWSVVGDRPAAHYWTLNPDTPAALGPLDTSGLWWFQLIEAPAEGRLTDDEIRQSFLRAVGREVPCEVVANGSWTAARLIAQRYRLGRVFLLGDAAHLHPPTGGYGMNMGVGDAVDLGWKLAAVLSGWGGTALLDSYEAERRPVHQRVVDEAVHNFERNPAQLPVLGVEEPGVDGDRTRKQVAEAVRAEKVREFASLGVQLGYRYENSPVVVPDQTDPTPNEVSTYVPTARPGHLAPHVWIDEERCLYDLLGPDFTLLRLGADAPDAEPLLKAAAAAGVPVRVLDLPDPQLRDLFEARMVLVRPDQHVAWRADELVQPDHVIDRVRGAETPSGELAAHG